MVNYLVSPTQATILTLTIVLDAESVARAGNNVGTALGLSLL